MGDSSISFSPYMLWDLYIRYLWNYQNDSWVASIASTFRVLAFLLLTPFVTLMLLDVTSYVIARTLGVIDDTKASTSEVAVVLENVNQRSSSTTPPSILVQDASADITPSSIESDQTPTPPMTIEPNPKLAGVNVFSPAPSQPPSPTLSRRDLSESLRMTSVLPLKESGENLKEEESVGYAHGEKRRSHAPSVSSSSGDSSYAVLEKDSEVEDMSGAHMRRRTTGVGASVDTMSDS